MAEFVFNSLRAEAMEGVERDPYVLKMPGRMKDVVIEDVPVKLFMASFDTDALVPAAGQSWAFLQAAIPTKDFERVRDFLADQPIEVITKLTTSILDHFNLVFGDMPDPKDGDGQSAGGDE